MGRKHNVPSCSKEVKELCPKDTYCRAAAFSMKREDGPKKYDTKEKAEFAAKRAIDEGYIPRRNKNGKLIVPKGHGGTGHILVYKCNPLDSHKKDFGNKESLFAREKHIPEFAEIFKNSVNKCKGTPELQRRNACFSEEFKTLRELRGI